MNILTKRNGVALIAVMAVLLILTLLLPLMFTMSENAMRSAMKGTDELRASYLARTMAEMSVAAFQDLYDEGEQERKNGNPNGNINQKLNKFYDDTKMNASTIYMFRRTDTDYDWDEESKPSETDVDAYEAWFEKQLDACFYSTSAPSAAIGEYKSGEKYTVSVVNKNDDSSTNIEGYYIGKASCNMTYDGEPEYYYITAQKVGNEIVYSDPQVSNQSNYEGWIAQKSAQGATVSETETKYVKSDNRKIEFVSTGTVNGKTATRRCVAVLPTKPAEQNWIVPANVESNQIFVDSSQASSVTVLSNVDTEDQSQNQPVYIYSCMGNMVLNTDEISLKITDEIESGWDTDAGGNFETKVGKVGDYITYKEFAEYFRKGYFKPGFKAPADISNYSLGVHPITGTRNPENDPNFNCVKTNNMSKWSEDAQRDNFVAFTATNGIKVDMPINLLINPTRTGRIGDGLSKNENLYKLMYFQSPTIVFNEQVNTFISLYRNTSVWKNVLLDYNANRMSTIVLSAPENSPYSYYNEDRKTTVRAGRVYFMEDAYVWLVPFTENGSDYKTQSVYYKGKDIILYKFANAGDVYLFNSEVSNDGSNNGETQGFSITNYFMDVIYNHTQTNNTEWWEVWDGMLGWLFDTYKESAFTNPTYKPNDLYYEGNVNDSPSFAPPQNDGLYVVWDS